MLRNRFFLVRLEGRVVLVLGLKVTLGALGVRLHGGRAWLPSGRAHLAVLVGELEGLHQAQCLIHVTAYGQIVDGNLTEVLLSVDDKKSPETQTLVLLEDPVGLADGHILVGQEGDMHVAEPTLLARPLTPGKVRKVGVGRASNHFTANLAEFLSSVVEGDDLGGADKGEVQGVEEQHNVLALVVG